MPSRPTASSVDEYIQNFPEPTREILEQVRSVIRAAAPAATEKISYAIPTYVLNGNLVHFAGFKSHIGFYPAPSAIEAFRAELGGYKQAKGSVQFPLSQPLPLDLIRRMVEFRVGENTAGGERRKGRKEEEKGG